MDDIKGDIVFGEVTRGYFSLYLDDMLLPMRNLIVLVRQQGAVYVRKHRQQY